MSKQRTPAEPEPDMEFIGGGPVYPGAPVITCACGNAHACAAAETGPVTDDPRYYRICYCANSIGHSCHCVDTFFHLKDCKLAPVGTTTNDPVTDAEIKTPRQDVVLAAIEAYEQAESTASTHGGKPYAMMVAALKAAALAETEVKS